jgi:hypothetical protein
MAGRVQLATTGLQDAFFTKNPEYTYFIKNFKRHTNFSVYTIDHDVHGELEFGNMITCTIPNDTGDLIKTISLDITLDAIQSTAGSTFLGYIESIGHAMIEHVDLYIGDTLVQRVPSDWLQIHSEHYVTQTKQTNLSKLIGKYPNVNSSGYNVSGNGINNYLGASTKEFRCIVDIPFYFYNNRELAIPLCALSKQDVKVDVKFRNVENCLFKSTSGTISLQPPDRPTGLINKCKLVTEMVCLEELERKKFQNTRLEYIITQIQQNINTIPSGSSTLRHKLIFSNPVKELYFVVQRKGTSVAPFDFDHTDQIFNLSRYINYENVRSIELELDGDVLLDTVTGNVIHMRAVQSGIHHSRTQLFRRFYSYSFALEPERWYPTGQRNFNLIKESHATFHLNEETVERELRVYALSYNILRIHDGVGRILFPSGSIGN